MKGGVVIQLEGDRAPEAAIVLARRLDEYDLKSVVDGATVTVQFHVPPEGQVPALTFRIDPHDSPEFATEKILDVLAEKGLVAVGAPGLSAEEEGRIGQRLKQLGYLE